MKAIIISFSILALFTCGCVEQSGMGQTNYAAMQEARQQSDRDLCTKIIKDFSDNTARINANLIQCELSGDPRGMVQAFNELDALNRDLFTRKNTPTMCKNEVEQMCNSAMENQIIILNTKISNINVFGKKPSHQESMLLVKTWMKYTLKDPDSAKIEIGAPYKSTCLPSGINQLLFCWSVPVDVNGKNSYGAYTGYKRYYFSIYNGKILDVIYKE